MGEPYWGVVRSEMVVGQRPSMIRVVDIWNVRVDNGHWNIL